MKQKQKPQTIELKTGLTCKIDKNGRVHVFNTKEMQPEPKTKEGVYLALFFILTYYIYLNQNNLNLPL